MFDLEAGYAKVGDFHRSWMNKMAAIDAKKVATLEQLKSTAEQKAKL